MKKNFDEWNEVKKHTQDRQSVVFFKEREVWWCNPGISVGFEQDGKGKTFERPVLVIKRFNRYIMIIVPLSTKIKKDNPFYYSYVFPDGLLRSIIISNPSH